MPEASRILRHTAEVLLPQTAELQKRSHEIFVGWAYSPTIPAGDANPVGEYAHPIHERLLSVNKNLSSPKHFSERLPGAGWDWQSVVAVTSG
ncbi:MAG TPA: hypothetical protein VFE47_09600, partial [Tepidisphaeraceae bacterium]|nr:hypothetical protein [Tepidisphaeraceae bacterium]